MLRKNIWTLATFCLENILHILLICILTASAHLQFIQMNERVVFLLVRKKDCNFVPLLQCLKNNFQEFNRVLKDCRNLKTHCALFKIQFSRAVEFDDLSILNKS